MVYFYIKFRLSKQPAVFIRMSNKYLQDYKTTLGVILSFWKRFHDTCHFYPSPCLSYSSFAYIRYLSVYFSVLQLHIFLQFLYHNYAFYKSIEATRYPCLSFNLQENNKLNKFQDFLNFQS